MESAQWALHLSDLTSLLPAQSCSERRWRPNAAARSLQAQRCRLHQAAYTHQPLPAFHSHEQSASLNVYEEIYRVILLACYWLCGVRMGHFPHQCRQERRQHNTFTFFNTADFAVIRSWELITLRRRPRARVTRSRMVSMQQNLQAVISPNLGGSRSRSRPRVRRKRRRYHRDKLNSSDDVIGIETMSTSGSTSDDEDRAPAAGSADTPATGSNESSRVRQWRTNEAAASGRPTEGIPPEDLGAEADLEDATYSHDNPDNRRAMRAASIAYRQVREQPNAQAVALGSRWSRVGSRWKLTFPIRGAPPPFNLVRIFLEGYQVPASPAAIEREAFRQIEGLRAYADRLMFVQFDTQAGGAALPHHQPLLSPWLSPCRTRVIEAVPDTAVGANDVTAEAFKKVRQNARLSPLLEPKTLRTVLQAQPKVAQRLLDTGDFQSQYDILKAACKRAGLLALFECSTSGAQRDASPPLDRQNARTPDVTSRAPPVAPSPLEPKQRWSKRSQQQESGERGQTKTGWRTVRRQTRTSPTWTLISEWTVPVTTAPCLNIPSITLCEDSSEAATLERQLRGTTAPTALVSRKKLQISDKIPVQRTAFHMERTLTSHDQAGNEVRESSRTPVVGFIYQLGGMHTVALKSAPQTSSFAPVGDTIVIRLLTAAQWAPSDAWELLGKGKHHVLKAELLRLVQAACPSQTTSLYDAFRLEQQGRIMSCCLRIATSALPHILPLSGKTWVFCHPLAAQCQSWPTVWSSEAWPNSLEPLYARARDAGAVSLSLGDRHVGFRCRKDAETAVRDALGQAPREAWILSGIPIAFSAQEANSVLSDMHVDSRVLEHTRKVQRNTQSWVVHLKPGFRPPEDTLHIARGGKDFFVTLIPATLKFARGTTVKQFTRPKKRTGEAPSYADVLKNEYPDLPRKQRPPPEVDRTQQLEKLVSALVGLLAGSGINLPPPIQALLHDHVPSPASKQADSDKDMDQDSTLSDDDPYLGDWHPGMPTQEAADFDDSFVEERNKRARTTSAAPAVHDILSWAHAAPLPFRHVAWGRVKGDGNCLWRSVSSLTNTDWKATKTATLALAPTLRDTWTKYFKISPTEYDNLIKAMEPDCAWGNELGLALLSSYFHRKIVVITVAEVWVTSVGCPTQPPLLIRLLNKHYDPIQQQLTTEMIDAVNGATEASTEHLQLAGGAHLPTLASWNVSALDSHSHEVHSHPASMLAIQETGCTQRSQARHSHQASKMGNHFVWGAPAPLMRTASRSWRTAKAQVPGVALRCRGPLEVTAVSPKTPEGHRLWRSGRLVMAMALLGATRTLITGIYMPSGDLRQVQIQRQQCMEDLLVEIESHWQVPMCLGGDWNTPPCANFIATALTMRGWTLPLHVNPAGDPDMATYVVEPTSSCLDYWLISPNGPASLVQTVTPHPGHRHRSVNIHIPKPQAQGTRHMVLPPLRWQFPKNPMHTCSPVNWAAIEQQITGHLNNDQLDLAWHLWEVMAHEDISSKALNPPSKPSAGRWHTARKYQARITKRGEESPRVARLFRLAQRLLDFGKWGGHRVLYKLQRDLPIACNEHRLPLTPASALASPLHASTVMHSFALSMHQQERSSQLKKWQTSLTSGHCRPTPILYQWLRGGSPAQAPALLGPEGPLPDKQSVFAAHRAHWETICRHEDPQQERLTVAQQLARMTQQCHNPISVQDIRYGISRLKPATSPGLDNWTADSIQKLSQDAYPCLCRIFNFIESSGQWPAPLLRTKITLLVKPGQDGTSVEHWRPIAITSFWYRLYGQIRLPALLSHVAPWLPVDVLGGIPQRNPPGDLLDFLSEFETAPAVPRPAAVWGVAVDASKCFDRVRWSEIWALLSALLVPDNLVRPLASFYLAHSRFTQIRGDLDIRSWEVSTGLLQGCPLSVLCTVTLVASWHAMLPHDVIAKSFIDDRLIYGKKQSQLQRAWACSTQWDKEQGWSINPLKTLGFTSLPKVASVLEGHPVASKFVYLGHDVRTTTSPNRETLNKRGRKAATSAARIAQLPIALPVSVKQMLVATVMSPQWAYGLLTSVPTQKLLIRMERSYRQAIWRREKKMHSWIAAVALVYDPSKHSAFGSQVFNHFRTLTRALRTAQSERLGDLWNSPGPPRPSGPIHVTRHFCDQLGFTVGPDFHVIDEHQNQYSLRRPSDRFWKLLTIRLRDFLLRTAQKHRPHFQTMGHIDWDVTRHLICKKSNTLISEIACVLSDGLWTAPRLQHAGRREARSCWWCNCEEQTPAHLFWSCPHWEAKRPPLSPQLRDRILEHPIAAHCGVCITSFPPELKNRWASIQTFMGLVVQGCNDYFRENERQARHQVQKVAANSPSDGDGGGGFGAFPPLPPLRLMGQLGS